MLAPGSYETGVRAAELALARLSGVSGLAPSVEWLLYDPQGWLVMEDDEAAAADEPGKKRGA